MEPAVVLGGLAALVVVGIVGPHRPRARRRLAGAPPVPVGVAGAGPAATFPARAAARLAGVPVDATTGRVGVAASVLSAVLLPVSPVLAPLAIVAGLTWLRWRYHRRLRTEADAWSDAVPEAVDLFAVAVGGGLTVAAALPIVAARAPPPLGPALDEAHRRARHGEALAVALGRMADAAPATRPLVAVLVAAHLDGGPVVDAMARLAADERAVRRQVIERRARQVPVRMLFPLVLCTLPAFVLLTVVPPILSALDTLRP